jgi:hypothetical protein
VERQSKTQWKIHFYPNQGVSQKGKSQGQGNNER